MTTRTSGILLHPTSLPNRYGIGDLGRSAYRFAEFLASAKQSIWQVLPLGPTGYGDSPYQSLSAFAGNPLLISPGGLIRMGVIPRSDLKPVPQFPRERVDYGEVIHFKRRLLARAFDRFTTAGSPQLRRDFEAFCDANAEWLDDFVLFQALKEAKDGQPWNRWDEEYRARDADALTRARRELRDRMKAARFAQFLFFSQWRSLKAYCNGLGIALLGDMPIFVAYDSSDVWANRHLFKLDPDGVPTVVAGVPPDYFSETGQLWGNPIYDWERMRANGFEWWIARMERAFQRLDLVRLDHFRGFSATWEVPATEQTAINGEWVHVPGAELFVAATRALGRLPIIAEDLGLITPDVEILRDQFGFPGMRVLQFGFSSDATNLHLPHNYVPNSVVYTGTHDNDTTVGWYHSGRGRAARRERAYCRRYLRATSPRIHRAFIRGAHASVARMAVIPLQDLLGCDSAARMNRPSSTSGNWDWRFRSTDLTRDLARWLRVMTVTFGRDGTILESKSSRGRDSKE